MAKTKVQKLRFKNWGQNWDSKNEVEKLNYKTKVDTAVETEFKKTEVEKLRYKIEIQKLRYKNWDTKSDVQKT